MAGGRETTNMQNAVAMRAVIAALESELGKEFVEGVFAELTLKFRINNGHLQPDYSVTSERKKRLMLPKRKE
jgi:hypothetical protein